MAIENLRDLFIGDLLIPKEKLQTFEDLVNSVDSKWLLSSANSNFPGDRERFLVISHVEDQIRANYKKFLDQLVAVSHDTVEALKLKSLRTMFDVFVNNPEQEKYLLSCMINKLGKFVLRLSLYSILKNRFIYRRSNTQNCLSNCAPFITNSLTTPPTDEASSSEGGGEAHISASHHSSHTVLLSLLSQRNGLYHNGGSGGG